jgi:hypothetical protein
LGGADAAVQEAVEKAKPGLAKVAMESELPVQELRAEDGLALYVSATDKTVEKPTATQFKYVDQGAAAVGRFMVSFTVLTNTKDTPGASAGARGRAFGAADHAGTAVADGGRRGGDVVPGEGLEAGAGPAGVRDRPLPGQARWEGREAHGAEPGDGDDRQRLSRGGACGMDGGRAPGRRVEDDAGGHIDESGGREALRARPARAPRDEGADVLGRTVDQQNVTAFLVRDGVWADVHLSKVNFKESDRELFEKVLRSVRIEE